MFLLAHLTLYLYQRIHMYIHPFNKCNHHLFDHVLDATAQLRCRQPRCLVPPLNFFYTLFICEYVSVYVCVRT